MGDIPTKPTTLIEGRPCPCCYFTSFYIITARVRSPLYQGRRFCGNINVFVSPVTKSKIITTYCLVYISVYNFILFHNSIFNQLATRKWPKFGSGRLQYQMDRRSARRRPTARYGSHVPGPPLYTNAAGNALKKLPVTEFTHLFNMMYITRF